MNEVNSNHNVIAKKKKDRKLFLFFYVSDLTKLNSGVRNFKFDHH